MKKLFGILTFALFVVAGCGDDSPEEACRPGSADCACSAEEPACAGENLTCIQGLCRTCENGGCVPLEPKCYSPCRGSFLDKSGKQRVCSEEGLVEGCLSGSRCDQGTCLPEAADPSDDGAAGAASAPGSSTLATTGDANDDSVPSTPGACESDPQCPEHQVCIAKRCYSTCDGDAECAEGSVCRRKVCRQQCDEQKPCQGLGYSCRKLGNTTSLCLPQVQKDPELAQQEPASDQGSFALLAGRDCGGEGCPVRPLRFTTTRTTGSFFIRNDSPVARVFAISKARQAQTGADGTDQVFLASAGENPLSWLELGEVTPARTPGIEVTIAPNRTSEIRIARARSAEVPRWQGLLEITTPGLGPQTVSLDYSERVPGRWSGKLYHFGNFGDRTPGHDQLNDWISARGDLSLAQKVPNALVRAWANYRAGKISGAELDAVLESVLTGSWSFARVQELCDEARGGVCAPFVGPANRPVISITNDPISAPVPSGVVEHAIRFSLGEGATSAACKGDANCFAGRIDSSASLQYPNNPALVLRFGKDPTDCGGGKCLTPLAELSSPTLLGARFDTSSSTSCDKAIDFGSKSTPWLVPGMRRDLEREPISQVMECRDSALPFLGDSSANVELAASNPVPDGLERRRTLELVDGLLIDQQSMLILFRETLESFLGGPGDVFSTYGLIKVQREPDEPAPEELVGTVPSEPSAPRSRQQLEAVCPGYLLSRVFPEEKYQALSDVSAQARGDLVAALLNGRTGDVSQAPDVDPTVEDVHYLCTWTELSQEVTTAVQSANTEQRARIDVACPPYSRVVYFTLPTSAGIDTTTCNETDTCHENLRDWALQPGLLRLPPGELSNFSMSKAAFDLTWGCRDSTQVLCDDYSDLRLGKRFLAAVVGREVMNPLETDIKEAFRYKFQFQNRDGQNVGFAPTICDASTRLVPYCYSPDAILDLKDRVDCALAVYDDHVSGKVTLTGELPKQLRNYLRKNFGFQTLPNPLGDPRIEDGFERLYSELLVMLGDDAYTASFASRFDLAQSTIAAFEGSEFEQGGIDLSGVAGHEMYKLYQASQYYQLVLDRFFAESTWLWNNLDTDQGLNGYLSINTVAGYLTRVIRASTQLSNTSNEIARRYQAFNRPDLARRVIERGYARSYLESQILSQFMRAVQQVVERDQQDQVAVAVSDAERSYRVAMLDMQNSYKRIQDDRTIFGFAPDYIPFPALEEQDDGAFPVLVARAKERLAVAETDEQRALSTNRAFETDAAAFQGELVKIRSDFEKQLGDLCGTFQGSDGKLYPAIARYKHLSDKYATLADPCGLEGGAIWDKGQDIGTRDLELRKSYQEATNLTTQAEALVARVKEQCRISNDTTAANSAIQKDINDLEERVDRINAAVGFIDRSLNAIGQTLVLIGEESYAIPGYVVAATALTGETLAYELQAADLRDDIRAKELEQTQRAAYAECEQFAADGAYEMRAVHREILLKNLDILLALGNLGVAGSELVQLNNQRLRLEGQWEDSNKLTINVQAAKNDPNVRIYKNDAIINADRSFESALREVYRATKVFEYYTGQSYAALDKLFLVRMVGAGDVNLKQYLAELEDAFFNFEEEFGKPATRVAVISLRDQVFRSPLYANGQTQQLSLEERVRQFRTALIDPKLVDDQGNIVVPFSTGFGELSPLTNNHKILFMEASIESAEHGDDVGRLYLRQLGSSAVVNADGERRTYAFPPRTAVLNPLFPSQGSSGREAFDTLLGGPTASIFRDYRFRDRPFVNSSWQLVFNPRTESVNRDIALSAIDDVKLYVYYTDFSNL